MKTTFSNNEMETMIAKCNNVIGVCNKQIEHLTHPETYGCCLSNCNSIVINKERMMTVTTDDNHMVTHEFSPLYPTYFSPRSAARIVKNEIFRDGSGARVQLEIIGKLEYYQLLKERAEQCMDSLQGILKMMEA